MERVINTEVKAVLLAPAAKEASSIGLRLSADIGFLGTGDFSK